MKVKYRLSLFFFLAIAACSLSLFLFVRQSTESLLRSFVFSGDAAKARIYASILGDYYDEDRRWTEVQSFLSGIPGLVGEMLNSRIHGGSPPSLISKYPAETISGLLSDRIVVADNSGVVVADTSGKLLGSVHPARHLEHGAPIIAASGQEGVVLVGSMIDSALTGYNEQLLRSIILSLLYGTLLASAIAFGLGLLFTAQVTRPIAALETAVGRIAGGDLGIAVDAEGDDEFAGLSRSFNAMTRELARLEEARKRMIADSAHELRTPVTLIQGGIEAMIDGIYPLDIENLKSLHQETLRLSRLIEMLRELELIDSGEMVLALEEVDLLPLARTTIGLFETMAREKDIGIELCDLKEGPLVVEADRVRLGEVIYNLLSNAIKYCPRDGRVRMCLGIKNGSARIRIEDSGPGIPAAERERVFERFYRIDKSRANDRGGRGLGLAIVREIVKAHNGSMALEDSALGGAAFVVSLPARQDAPAGPA